MTQATCSEGDCGKPAHGRGWCKTHYARWMRAQGRGRTKHVTSKDWTPTEADAERFWDRADVGHPLGCWLWSGWIDRDGYGRASVAGATLGTHRFAWMQLRGPIPDGLVIDHLCRNRACCNPDHLEVVTQATNVKRQPVLFGYRSQDSRAGQSPTGAKRPVKSSRLMCRDGHRLTPGNTYTRPSGRRECRTCRAARRHR